MEVKSSEVFFSEAPPQRYILLHLTPDLLDERLFIKPTSDTSTVLCTDRSTYQLKDVQQSNSLMFLSSHPTSSSDDLAVQGEAVSWLESTLVRAPKIDLSHVPVFDGKGRVTGISSQQLFHSLPAAEGQITEALLHDLCLETETGYVRLDPAYVITVLKLVVSSLMAEGVKLDRVDKQAYLSAMRDEVENPHVLMFLLRRFSTVEGDGKTKSIDLIYMPHILTRLVHRMDGYQIARYSGLYTLEQSAYEPISCTKFASLWTQNTPVQLQKYCTGLDCLAGNFVQPVSSQIQYFSQSALSMDGRTRVSQLLDVKERWAEDDILPFLADLDGGTKAAQSVLMKHAKKVKVGRSIFIERRGK